MKTTRIFTDENFDTFEDVLNFIDDFRSNDTKEVKILFNKQTAKYVLQLVDVTE